MRAFVAGKGSVEVLGGKVKEGGRIKREDKLGYPRMRDPVEVQPGQPRPE